MAGLLAAALAMERAVAVWEVVRRAAAARGAMMVAVRPVEV